MHDLALHFSFALIAVLTTGMVMAYILSSQMNSFLKYIASIVVLIVSVMAFGFIAEATVHLIKGIS